MKNDEVIAMIDAISEGRYYAHSFETTPNSNSISIEVGSNHPKQNPNASEEFWFSSFDAGTQFLAKINNPRTAREIAGALLAWATRRELGENMDRRDVGKICVLAAGTSNVEFPSVNDWVDIKCGRSTREEWYRRSAPRMSLETLKRNRDDLRAILSDTTDTYVSDDIARALTIINDELYKRDQG